MKESQGKDGNQDPKEHRRNWCAQSCILVQETGKRQAEVYNAPRNEIQRKTRWRALWVH